MKTKGKRQKSAGIGFAEWDLLAHQKLSDFANSVSDAFTQRVQKQLDNRILAVVDTMIREGIKIATKDYDCLAYLAADPFWNTRSPRDPTTIYVELPLGENEVDSPRWSFSLAAIVRDAISYGTNPSGEYAEKSPDFLRLSKALRALADDLERASKGAGIKP